MEELSKSNNLISTLNISLRFSIKLINKASFRSCSGLQQEMKTQDIDFIGKESYISTSKQWFSAQNTLKIARYFFVRFGCTPLFTSGLKPNLKSNSGYYIDTPFRPKEKTIYKVTQDWEDDHEVEVTKEYTLNVDQ